MTDSLPQQQTRNRLKEIVVPIAKALEKFFWDLAWFALLCMLIFGGTCIPRSIQQGGPREKQQGTDAAGSDDLSDLQLAPEVED